jgi:hypothetical protein
MKWNQLLVLLLLTDRLAVAAENFAGWRHYKAVHFNTSETGANVAGDVANLPVALALSAGNFDFSQAKADGSDLRLSSNPDGGVLPHSIEHWDRSNRTALVWVKVPLVRGNSSAQSIFLHWGNAAANATSDSKAVFDTGDGFVGVWHLADDGNMEPDGYKDATANAAHGTGINLGRSSRVEARVGKGVDLRWTSGQWIRVGGEKRKLFDITTNLTFSIWAKARSYGSRGDSPSRQTGGYETMFAKGDNSWRLQKFGIKSWHKPPAELIEVCVEQPPRADLCVVGRTDMVTNQWFHLVGVHQHPKVRLYVNGVLDKEENFDVPWRSDDHAVGIGNQSQFPDRGRQWDGWLDEARVLGVAKDEHWIRLDYESQREGQKFLTFGPAQNRY